MSDDLISRKALLKELREIMDEPHNTMFLMGIGAAVSIVEHRETAFDKEKVIEELEDYLFEKYCVEGDEKIADIVEKGAKMTNREAYERDCNELEQYREIGTVEECREAAEKQKPKKPIPINYQKYANKIENADFLEDSYLCPNCKTVIRSGSYCNRCGQKINWSKNLEGMEDE